MAAELPPPRERNATAVTSEIDENVVSVKLVVYGIQPVMFGDKKRAKNAELDIKLEPRSLSMAAKVESPKGTFTLFKYKVNKLPSNIDVQQSTWKVKKDMVSLKLYKAAPESWIPYITDGLDQAASDSEEEKLKGGDE